MDLCLVVITILISVPSSPNAPPPPRPTSPMPHHLIIVGTDVVSLCQTAHCITTRETRIYSCHRPQHWCVHRRGLWKILSSLWRGNHVYMYPVSYPTHLHYICESFSLRMTLLISFYLLWIFHGCSHVGRLVSIASLIVWHIAAAPLLARFDSYFVISIEYSYPTRRRGSS